MTVLEPGATIEELREGLHRISPPYLFRKYEATEDDFEELADEDLRCEYMAGVLIVHSPATLDHEDRVSFLMALIRTFVAERQLGRVFGSNAVMQLGRPRLCADISFLAAEHGNRVRGGRVMGPMDLAVEVISNSTRSYDLGEKREKYRAGRVPEIRMLDAGEKRCRLDCLAGRKYRSRTLTKGRFASRVLRGLSIDVTWLWADPLPNPLDCLKLAR
jgi:Uma2 family endonuclease